jgi:hypothetical protein
LKKQNFLYSCFRVVRSKVVSLLLSTVVLLLLFTVNGYAQLGVSDTTGFDTVYFHSSSWCAKVDVYATSANKYAEAGEFCVAAALSGEVGDSLTLLNGASCAAAPLSIVGSANPDSIMVEVALACVDLCVFTMADTMQHFLSGSCASGLLCDSMSVAGGLVLGARHCAAAATSGLPAGVSADSVLLTLQSHCAAATSFILFDTAALMIGTSCFDGYLYMADDTSKTSSVTLTCGGTAMSQGAGRNVDSMLVAGGKDCGGVVTFGGKDTTLMEQSSRCFAANLAGLASDSVVASVCASTALAQLLAGDNPDSLQISLGGICGGVIGFTRSDTARTWAGDFCAPGRFQPAAGDSSSSSMNVFCAATALSMADKQNPDSIMVSEEGWCIPATMFKSHSNVDSKLGSYCSGAFVQDTVSLPGIFSQTCAATPLSFANGRNPDSIVVRGGAHCAEAKLFELTESISMYGNAFCSAGKFSHSKIEINTAFMSCALVRIPSAVDITFIGARFDSREWGFKSIPNNLLWLCNSHDPVTLKVRAASPATFLWYDKQDPTYSLSSADTLHLGTPVREGEYYAVGYGYGNNVSPTMTVKICSCDFTKTSQGDTTIYAYINSNLRISSRIVGGSTDMRYNRYQWFMDGAAYGAPSAMGLLMMNVGAVPGVHKFVARAISPCDTLYSDTITLVVCAPIAKVDRFTAHGMTDVNLLPGGKTIDVCLNTDLELRAGISGAAGYRWYKDGVAVASGSDSVYKVNAQIQHSDSGVYRVTVYNRCGDSASVSVKINVRDWLTVKRPLPSALSICEGDSLSLKYVVKNALTYAWTKDGVSIGGASDSTLFIASLDTLASGRYVVQASNGCDVETDTLILTVKPQARVSVLYADTMACVGNPFSFVAAARYADGMRWYRGGVEVAPGATYGKPSAELSDAGAYTLLTYNTCKNDTLKLHLHVNASISVDKPMADTTYYYEGRDLRLSFGANEGLGYSWYHLVSGSLVPIASAGSDSIYLKRQATLADSGYYVAESYNGCGVVRDTTLALAYARTRITLPLRDTTACEGNPLTLTANAIFADSVEWYHNGVKISGGVGAYTLTLTAAKPTDAGTYMFVAVNLNNRDTSICTVTVMKSLHLKTPLNGGADSLTLCEGDS